MINIPITTVYFDGQMAEREIPSFRGAIMAVSGNHPLFHNHTAEAKDIFRYPRVQYKLIDGHPAVIGVEEGSDAVRQLFLPGATHILKIGRSYRSFTVSDVQNVSFPLDVLGGEKTRYRLHSWLPFNSENYEAYQQISSLAERVAKLDAILTGNILSFYKAFNVFIEGHLTAHVIDLESRNATFKGVRMIAFEALIESNFALPEHCGIGKGVSHGFGVVNRI